MAKINRREALLVGAGAVMAKALTVTTACARTGGPKSTNNPGNPGNPGNAEREVNAALAEAAHACCGTGRNCLQHCLKAFARGDSSMAGTAQAVNEMMPVCEGVATLAHAGSEHLSLAARLCSAVCQSVVDAHTASGSHDEACQACVEACRRTIKAARAVI